MPKISVIIPVYNVEKYIARCAESLFSQTLDDIEYIFIDDCTPDKSIEILNAMLDKYPHRKDSVRIMRMQENSRQAAVRKYGMQIATGDYIIHCDSDDWVEVDLYEKMYSKAIHSDADVVICPIVDEYETYSSRRKLIVYPDTGKQLVEKWYNTNIGMFLWNKLVRRKIFIDNEIFPFDGINIWEDNGLMLRAFYYVNKISSINEAAYHYNQANPNTITARYGRREIYQMINCAKLVSDFYSDKYDADRYKLTINSLKYLAKLNLVTTSYDWLKEFKTLFPESNAAAKYISLDAFSTKGKIRFMFAKYRMAWLFVLLYKALNFKN